MFGLWILFYFYCLAEGGHLHLGPRFVRDERRDEGQIPTVSAI